MKLSLKIARSAVLGLTLATAAMVVYAQDSKPPDKKAAESRKKASDSAPARQHEAPAAEQPRQQRHVAAPVAPASQPTSRRESPGQPATPTHQAQPNSAPTTRTPEAAPSGQGRTFGNNPSNQQTAPSGQGRTPGNNPSNQQTAPSGQGRTFGNNPSNQQTAPSGQGRTFGNNPSNQQTAPSGQGRTFGNNPSNQQTAPSGQGRTPGNNPSNQQTAPGGQGRTFGNNPSGRGSESPGNRTFTTRTGDVIHRDAGGQVRQVRMQNGTTVYHPPNGPRRIEMARPGGGMVVASSPGHGYVQHSVVVRNTTVIKRTYIYNGVPQARLYRPRVYNGINLAIYTPVRYYRPTFYAYAYNPWARPISYGWGWTSSPWYGYYGGYFRPYPVYASPALWLTDYMIAATLEAAYQERMADRAAASAYRDDQSVPMSPEVKQAIADEVRRQIDMERSQGQNAGAIGGPDSLFADNVPHVFVVNSNLMVSSNAGDCSIGEGDVLQMNGAPPPNSPFADLVVLSSRGLDCRRGSRVSVQLQDLQEMQNQMLATIDRGLGELQSNQGQGGLPPLPQGSAGTIDSPFAQEAQPDANVAGELASATREADRAEQVVSQAGDAPPTLSLGMGIEDVKAIQGVPLKIVDLGSKQIYMYKDLKITFSEGRVVDIQ